MPTDGNNLAQLLGGIIQGGTTIASAIEQSNEIEQQNKYEQMVFSFNSAMATSKANETLLASAEAGAIQDQESSQRVGRMTATAAGGGLEANSGTNQTATDQEGAVGAHNALMTRMNGEREALTLTTQATEENMQGEIANSESQNKERSTIWSGATKALGQVSEGFNSMFPAPQVSSSGTMDTSSSGQVNWKSIPMPSTPYGTTQDGQPVAPINTMSAQFGQTMESQNNMGFSLSGNQTSDVGL